MDKRIENLEMDIHGKSCNTIYISQYIVGPSWVYCASPMHMIEHCPTHYEEVSAMYQSRLGQGQYQQKNSHSNTYNEGMQEHPNVR